MRFAFTCVAALALAAPGCEELETSPGEDFAVEVLRATIDAGSSPVFEVEVRVTGCPAFEAAFGANGATRAVTLVPGEGGTFRARIPRAWVAEGDVSACGEPAAICDEGGRHWCAAPGQVPATLEVTCESTGQRASAGLLVRYDIMTFLSWPLAGEVGPRPGARSALFPGDVGSLLPEDPILPYAVTVLDASGLTRVWQPGGGGASDLRAEVRVAPERVERGLVLAARGSDFWMPVGCPDGNSCPRVPTGCQAAICVSRTDWAPTAEVESELLFGTTGPGAAPHWALVAGHVDDVAYLDDGTVVALSYLPGDEATLLSYVDRATLEVDVSTWAPGHRPVSGFTRTPGGALAFLTQDPGGFDVLQVEGRELLWLGGVQGGSGRQIAGPASLSPDASQVLAWLMEGGDNGPIRPWLGLNDDLLPLEGLVRSTAPAVGWGGVAWNDEAVAIWDRERATVTAFDRAPPHARRFEKVLPPVQALLGVVGLGQRFVVTTRSGVEILDLDGTSVVDADPLPCGSSPAAPAVRAGPGRSGEVAAVLVDDAVMAFPQASPSPHVAAEVLPGPDDMTGRGSLPLGLRVSGCTAFDAAFTANGRTFALPLDRTGTDRYEGEVPAAWLEGENSPWSCMPQLTFCSVLPVVPPNRNVWCAFPRSVDARVTVACRSPARTVEATARFRYAAGVSEGAVASFLPHQVYPWSASKPHTDFLFPGDVGGLRPDDAVWPFSVSVVPGEGAAFVYQLGDEWHLRGTFPIQVDPAGWAADPLLRPRLAAKGADFWLSVGCPGPGPCPVVPVATTPGLSVAGAALVGTPIPSADLDVPVHEVFVPAGVIDLTFLEDGSLTVLSHVAGEGLGGETFLTQVDPASRAVEVVGHLPLYAVTRFSREPGGALVFVAREGDGRLHLYRFAGGLLTRAVPMVGVSPWVPWLSPEGQEIVVWNLWDGAVSASAGPLEDQYEITDLAGASPGLDGENGGVIWSAGGFHVWDRATGKVRSYTRYSPPALVRSVDAGPGLLGAFAVGDELVLTTPTGVLVLGWDDGVVLDLDPLPCGLAPTAAAVKAGPGRDGKAVAVQAGPYVLVLDRSHTLDGPVP